MLCCILNTDYVCRNCHEKYCWTCVSGRYLEPDCIEGRPTCRKCLRSRIWVQVKSPEVEARIDKALEEERLSYLSRQSQV